MQRIIVGLFLILILGCSAQKGAVSPEAVKVQVTPEVEAKVITEIKDLLRAKGVVGWNEEILPELFKGATWSTETAISESYNPKDSYNPVTTTTEMAKVETGVGKIAVDFGNSGAVWVVVLVLGVALIYAFHRGGVWKKLAGIGIDAIEWKDDQGQKHYANQLSKSRGVDRKLDRVVQQRSVEKEVKN